jgi:hypothetical protein
MRSRLAQEVVSEGVARRRKASRVPHMCPKGVRVFNVQTTVNTVLQAFCESPLTNSNRRPPPYHRVIDLMYPFRTCALLSIFQTEDASLQGSSGASDAFLGLVQ